MERYHTIPDWDALDPAFVTEVYRFWRASADHQRIERQRAERKARRDG